MVLSYEHAKLKKNYAEKELEKLPIGHDTMIHQTHKGVYIKSWPGHPKPKPKYAPSLGDKTFRSKSELNIAQLQVGRSIITLSLVSCRAEISYSRMSRTSSSST